MLLAQRKSGKKAASAVADEAGKDGVKLIMRLLPRIYMVLWG